MLAPAAGCALLVPPFRKSRLLSPCLLLTFYSPDLGEVEMKENDVSKLHVQEFICKCLSSGLSSSIPVSRKLCRSLLGAHRVPAGLQAHMHLRLC